MASGCTLKESSLTLRMHLNNYFSFPLTPQPLSTLSCPQINFSWSPELMAPATPAFFHWLYHAEIPFCIGIFSDSPLSLECSAPNLPLGHPVDTSFGQSILIEAFFSYPTHTLGYYLIALLHIILKDIVYLFNYFVNRTPPHTPT